YRRAELLGQTVETLLPERFRAGHVQQRNGYFAEPRVRAMGSGLDLWALRKDGREFPVEISLSPLQTRDGLLAAATIRDVSARREAEARLRHAETRYRTLVEEIPAVTFMAALDDSASEISELYVSPQIETLLGFSQKEWLEDPVLWFTRLHPDDRDRWHVEFARTCATAEPFDAVYRFLARDGRTVWVHGHAKVVRDKEGRPLFLQGIAFDITDRKRAEEALAQLNEVLERRVAEAVTDAECRARELARSNADLDRFAYIASHDLREPLRTMLRYVQLLEKRYKDRLDETAADYLARTDANIRQMNQLIEDLHVHSRVGREGSFAPVDCSEVLAEVCANLRVAVEETGATIAIDPLPTVNGVRTHLVILLQNLIQNAIKFRADQPPQIHVTARRVDGERWLFEVRDNGTGIEPQYFQKIFEVGERLHGRKIPGTGFGLANSQRIVERHGGTIWIDSQVGSGSTFSFLLPACDPSGSEHGAGPARGGVPDPIET
ncbi:MAG TPA: PAS domain S-box protein, partial [Planctomycetaceae bacterium]|nr:PAS domain S-box protein [Planctomycetaceae bacterium]